MAAACEAASAKRMFFGFDMIYIDESAIYVGTDEEVSVVVAAHSRLIVCASAGIALTFRSILSLLVTHRARRSIDKLRSFMPHFLIA